MGKLAPKTSYFLLAVLLLIVIAFAASYYRYVYTLSYDLFLYGSCEPEKTVCVTDEEKYYGKYLVAAASVESYCANLDPDACVEDLIARGLANMQDCEEFLEEGESCSDPQTYEPEPTLEEGVLEESGPES
jgi:hypothetical protein